MSQARKPFTIAVFAGDGIGPEVMEPCVNLLTELAASASGFSLHFDWCEAGAGCYQKHGEALPAQSMEKAVAADAILLGAMGLPSVRYPDGTEIAPQLELREKLGLYAGLRPIRAVPGVPPVLADGRASQLDIVLVRESTEGLFAARGKTVIQGRDVALDTMRISRECSEKLFDFAFEEALRRKALGYAGRVTCVDKANVLGSFAFFRSIFLERAARYPQITAECAYVDAVGLNLVLRPWRFDVLVTENMFGDILSDVGAGLIGGMGMAPSADIGDRHAVFQPCHGSAPDIAGRGIANPAAMLLSAAMMLDWLGARHSCPPAAAEGKRLLSAVHRAFGEKRCVPPDIAGGQDGTLAVVTAVRSALSS